MRRPLVYITVGFIIGIAIGHNFNMPLHYGLLLIGLSFLCLIMAWHRSISLLRISLACLVMVAGIVNYTIRTNNTIQDDIIPFIDKGNVQMSGTVWSKPVCGDNSTSIDIHLQSISTEDRTYKVDSLIRVYVNNSKKPFFDPKWGDMVKFTSRLRIPSSPTNPGQFNWRNYLKQRGIAGISHINFWNSARITGEAKMPFLPNIRMSMLSHIREAVESSFQYPYDRLLISLLLGDRSQLPGYIEESFQRAGIFHLLAVSGLHVGFIGLSIFGLLVIMGINNKKAAFIAIFIIIGYGFLVGGRPSVLRAVIMMVTGFVSIILERDKDMLSALALSAFVFCVFAPQVIFDIGFQLSYMAVLGIFLLTPILVEQARYLPYLARYGLAVSMSAFLTTAPLTALYFNYISPAGIIASIICSPLAGLVMKFGALNIVFHFLVSLIPIPIILNILVEATSTLLQAILMISELFASITFGSITVGSPALWFIIGYYSSFIWIVFPERLNPFINVKKYRVKKLIIALSFIIALVIWVKVVEITIPRIEVVFFDVGNGDSIFIKTNRGNNMLIDGGSGRRSMEGGFDSGENIILPFLKNRGIAHIDLIVLTHPHEDHVGGLVSVIEEMSVGLVMDIGVNHSINAYNRFLDTIDEKNINYLVLHKGMKILYDDMKGKVIHPSPEHLGEFNLLNDLSAVIMLKFGDMSFLFTGDIERQAEGALVLSDEILKCDVLKVAHHGSNTSTSREFLGRACPGVAVISTGDNIYGHPSRDVINRLIEEEIEVYRTDKHGAITIISRGHNLSIRKVISDAEG